MTEKVFRVIDTGVRDGRAQIAFDQALVDARNANAIPDTIRFLQFPPTALIGRHQALSQELKLDYCRANDIRTVRRITGGGALYFDEGQLGWELVFNRATLGVSALADLTREICEAAAVGISRLGVEARYRPRSDIEVDGQKISGTGGFFDRDTLFYQGTLLIDMNPAAMVAALNLPQAPKNDGATAPRITTLKALLGEVPPLADVKQALLDGFAERLGISPEPGSITEHEEALARQYFDEDIGTDEFVAEIDDPGRQDAVLTGVQQGPGGTVSTYIRLEGAGNERFREVLIAGDFFVTPPRVVLDLEAALRGTLVKDVRQTVEQFFERTEVGLITVAPDDFAASIEAALEE